MCPRCKKANLVYNKELKVWVCPKCYYVEEGVFG
jgi:ribosomal protein L37AE/L43A